MAQTVTAALIPEANDDVQMTTEIIVKMPRQRHIGHRAALYGAIMVRMLLSHPETLSRLNARRMKGTDKANPILTVISLVSELFMQGMA
jgi:hypothetical protein